MDDEQVPKISSEISPHINDKQLGRLNSYATTDNRAQGNNNDVHKFVANVSFACSSRFGHSIEDCG